jgi:putative FmdB family regulatory protein
VPTYEYACKSCGEHLEVVQSFKDDALTECPNCKGELRKVFGSIGIAFKGSGFYKTDSRSKTSAAKTREGKDSAAGESSSAGEAKSDTKGESKSPTSDAKTSSKKESGSGSAKGGSGGSSAATAS